MKPLPAFTPPNPRFIHPCPSVKELQSLANRPVLEEWEACKLMQGLCPNLKIGKGELTWLDDYRHINISVKDAKRKGILDFPIAPKKLVNWCISNKIPLPENFSSVVIKLLFHLKRPKDKIIDTNELVRGSSSDLSTKHYPVNERKPGKRAIKKEATIRGYESEVYNHARTFCISYINENGTMPLKKTINLSLADQLSRSIPDISRAYTLEKIFTPKEENSLRQKYRKNLRDFNKDARKV